MGVNNMMYSIKRKQKKAIKSPYLGIFCRNERRDILVSEYLYYVNNIIQKINNNPKVIINVNIKFARSRIRTCEPEGRRLKRRGIDQLTDSR